MAQQQKPLQPPQHQDRRPGLESEMTPRPAAEDPKQQGCSKLNGKVALITGGDSGSGRAVAPGPIWTPLIPSTFPEEKVAKFGADTPMKRPVQPEGVAPCQVFLAFDSSYMTGQILHPNGGEVVNG